MNDHESALDNELEKHSHLKVYLDYYKTLASPGYGVLVTGDWGSGKTHQVRNILKTDEFHYISLFGTQTTEEIYSAVYAKMFPLQSAAKNIATSSNGAGAGSINIGGLVSGVASAFIREQVKNDKIIVFDDLERSRIKTNDLLGVFNKYIEHHGCRVIVLAHDKKITETLKDIKEKVFGQTISITPQTSEAFEEFASKITDKDIAATIKKIKSVILDIFNQSETYSLRILKHSLDDLTRLLELLSPTHRENEKAITELSGFFLALSLEVRSGRLNDSDLTDREDTIFKHKMSVRRSASETPPPIYIASEKYKDIDLGNRILNDETLIKLLTKGIYSKKSIHESLDQSLYFTKAEDLPAWLVFMKFDELSEAESSDAAAKLIQQFDAREIEIPGEIRHLFSLRFLLSEMGLLPRNYDQIEAECKKYMDDLLSSNKVEPFKLHYSSFEDIMRDSFDGYGYWVEEDYRQHFERVSDYIRETQDRATKQHYPAVAKLLLKLVLTDGIAFAEKISYKNGEFSEYSDIDILSSIDPSDFVQEWMGSPANNWIHISKGLVKRYSSNQLSSTLASERDWMKEVIKLLIKEEKKSKGVRQKRISRALSLNLNSISL
ncbi:hypothetical protein SAMN04490179_4261 [Pseudomonas antarctica]|uniref:KAP NTPase domain-containing protein n=1 Tax=Pseudomonas antarctica TaxID=219572 RepID=A0A1H0BEJ5_9PSED|nr:hypothetical protein [Pseudomonas antarctica]KAF2406429.1 hypothetical protein PSAN_46040 [Pseudomonas antarctica]SDN44072.1 hypothetical protein SAMN04490179_4261 [Pseudomonas antarctica]